MTGKYAIKTRVPIVNTRNEIEATLKRYGAKNVAFMMGQAEAIVAFELVDRRVRFDIKLPEEEPKHDQLRRSLWRSLLLSIKAKLESVAAGIETFEEAFLAHVVMPGGYTVYEQIRERLTLSYVKPDKSITLLPPPKD